MTGTNLHGIVLISIFLCLVSPPSFLPIDTLIGFSLKSVWDFLQRMIYLAELYLIFWESDYKDNLIVLQRKNFIESDKCSSDVNKLEIEKLLHGSNFSLVTVLAASKVRIIYDCTAL